MRARTAEAGLVKVCSNRAVQYPWLPIAAMMRCRAGFAFPGRPSLADPGDLADPGEPGAVVVPASTSLLTEPAARPVLGEAGRGRRRGEQAGDLGNGQRGHSKVSGRWLIRVYWQRRLGIGAVAQQGGGDGADG